MAAKKLKKINTNLRGVYRHYKGTVYTVLHTATSSETLEEMVCYHQQGTAGTVWVRPVDSFLETVELGGMTVRRFAHYPSEESRLQIEAGEKEDKCKTTPIVPR